MNNLAADIFSSQEPKFSEDDNMLEKLRAAAAGAQNVKDEVEGGGDFTRQCRSLGGRRGDALGAC